MYLNIIRLSEGVRLVSCGRGVRSSFTMSPEPKFQRIVALTQMA